MTTSQMLNIRAGGFITMHAISTSVSVTGQIEQDDGDMRDTFKPLLLRKGAVWIYRHYLKGHLPMKKRWDGKFTHDTELAGAA
ncbi:hypothetical protein [Citrobacter youngae]|uniref:hypothetical protein n=1 Tax=Citrobacter youngae TaxID=133448 RepID=UPI000E13DF95|nr:Uncharacterised protein [Citrobacter youngae]